MEDVERHDVDRVVCLGDVVGYGPKPCECLDRVMEMEFCVLGNHDSSALFDPEGFNVAAEQAIFWTRAQLECGRDGPEASRKRMDFLCAMPRTVREKSVLFVHGSPRGPTNEYVFPEDIQNAKKMEKLFSVVPGVCFQGHTHVPGIFSDDLRFLRPSELDGAHHVDVPGRKWMVNVGSVGQPRDGDPRSCYVVFDQETVRFQRVEYDIERTVREIEAEPELDDFLGHRLRDGR